MISYEEVKDRQGRMCRQGKCTLYIYIYALLYVCLSSSNDQSLKSVFLTQIIIITTIIDTYSLFALFVVLVVVTILMPRNLVPVPTAITSNSATTLLVIVVLSSEGI